MVKFLLLSLPRNGKYKLNCWRCCGLVLIRTSKQYAKIFSLDTTESDVAPSAAVDGGDAAALLGPLFTQQNCLWLSYDTSQLNEFKLRCDFIRKSRRFVGVWFCSGHIEFSAFRMNSIRVIQIQMDFFSSVSFLSYSRIPLFLHLNFRGAGGSDGNGGGDRLRWMRRFWGKLFNFKRLAVRINVLHFNSCLTLQKLLSFIAAIATAALTITKLFFC